MSKKLVLFITIFGCVLTLSAQKKKGVLFDINNSPVYAKEFKRVYMKNIDLVKDESQKDVDKYLDLFINYKLKLEEAKALDLDKKKTYIKELEGYKKQLSASYLTDPKASEALVKNAYDRSLERINASHILITVGPNASAKDTLAAYQKIEDLRKKIVGGEDFKEVAKAYSQDPSAKQNGGDLGWFSVFRMVYPFENAAYTTSKGGVSKPFRSQFGYHILRVNDREKTLGDITVAHIMVAKGRQRSGADAENRVHDIDKQLKQGASFESLAKEYSDDRNTAINGGKIKRFGQGALSAPEFEKAAFGLTNVGDISKPIQTKYGWHIIKLLEKHPIKTFEEQKSKFSEMVKKDSRSKLITDSFINSLRKEYGVSRNEEAIQYFAKLVPTSKPEEDWGLADQNDANKTILKIKEELITYEGFADYLKNTMPTNKTINDTGIYVNKMYDEFEAHKILKYYEEHLEETNEDYANILSEYRDGLLLFDLMETKIWSAAKSDSVQLNSFYESRKEQYKSKETYKILKASSTSDKMIKKVNELLVAGKSLKEVKKEIASPEQEAVIFSEEEISKGEGGLPEGIEIKAGAIGLENKDKYYILIRIKEIIPEKLQELEDVKGKVINDFQAHLEENWLVSLRKKYEVKVKSKTLKKIKKELSSI